MATPKHKIFFGLVSDKAGKNTLPISPEAPPPTFEMPEFGWSWDQDKPNTTETIFSSELKRFDQGYSTVQLDIPLF